MSAKPVSTRRSRRTKAKRRHPQGGTSARYKSRGYSMQSAILDDGYPVNDLPCSLYQRGYMD